ncbi:MAG: DUF192 domain-containing protein [Nonlabens sp.]|uniref:DUF192 domain-containing protein n=1 Tax=Nonlabens sp. TaxID=1888209 RepID=UPI003EF3F56E
MRNSIFSIIVLAVILSGCRHEKANVLSTADVTFTKEATGYLIKKTTKDTIQLLDLEIADTEYDVQTGLMYRTSMKNNQAMLFVFEAEQELAFYMKNTQIPLDIIYLNADGAIVSFVENAKPMDETLLPSEAPAQYTLEINAGLAEKWGLDLGDVLVWE